MKVYNLSCQHDHRFEGWFASEADFVAQLEKKLIGCPACESQDIKRLPSAPRLNLLAPEKPQPNAMLDLQNQWMDMARMIVADTEDVGERFAEEARRIHYKETAERGIRGVASLDEHQALAEEGIDVMYLPMPDALKRSLQ